jgi:hypothetical protein
MATIPAMLAIISLICCACQACSGCQAARFRAVLILKAYRSGCNSSAVGSLIRPF